MVNIFISFRELDKDYREGFEGMLLNPNSPLKGTPISSREDVRGKGESAVKKYIREMIDQSHIVIVLIGNDTHISEWIDYEMDLSTSKRKPIFGVRIEGTTGGGPDLFKRRNLHILDWDPNQISEKINKMI